MEPQRELYRNLTGFVSVCVLLGGLLVIGIETGRGGAGSGPFFIGVLFMVIGTARLLMAVFQRN